MDAALEHAVVGLERALEGRLVEARRLTGGASATVYALELETSSGARRRVVFRRHTSAFKGHDDAVTAKEHAVLVQLHRSGLAVPEP